MPQYHGHISMALWPQTRDISKRISEQTGETMMQIIHRAVCREYRRLKKSQEQQEGTAPQSA